MAVLLAAWAAVEICTLQAAIAAPPGASSLNALYKPTGTPGSTQEHTAPMHLDLRAPSHLTSEEWAPIFPSAIAHRAFATTEGTAQLSSFGPGNPRIRPPLAELARHIQHEGLPVARLWENHSALLHIGLNQRGKPGLWLVQKIN